MAALHQASPAELKAQLDAERRGEPFLVYRDGSESQVIAALQGDRATVGRGDGCDVQLEWDGDASRIHAELTCLGGVWTVTDDGLSRNGTFVNGDRVSGRRRLRDGDSLRFGGTVIRFRDPAGGETGETNLAGGPPPEALVTESQRRVLVALCRPFRDGGAYATPATNQQIADELFLSVDAVKTHLRGLFERFEIGDVPQNQKRVKLVERAFQSGALSTKDL